MLRTLALAGALVVGFGALARADDHHGGDDAPGPGWITFDQASQKLHGLGYSEILKLKADDGSWKAKAVKDGTVYKIRLDPRTGDVAAQDKAEGRDKDHDDD